ncbi:hypothetical protein NQ317_000682 [Molorchus minor]|uniref:Uncharacterized protein n=1 Tax=Molorchus minor TaxID=1323400 RepID=A0ABQ9JCP8_9CUCU|nr:hypothetical protein NQ317_000682 [Molorchus minor]
MVFRSATMDALSSKARYLLNLQTFVTNLACQAELADFTCIYTPSHQIAKIFSKLIIKITPKA